MEGARLAFLFLARIIQLLKPGGWAAVVLPSGSLFGEDVKAQRKEHRLEECNLHTIVRLSNSAVNPYASIGTSLLFFGKGEAVRETWYWEHWVLEGQTHYAMTHPINLGHLADGMEWWRGKNRKGRVECERAWKVDTHEKSS